MNIQGNNNIQKGNIAAGGNIKENVFITMAAKDLENISDFDGALQLTTDALKAASKRHDCQIWKTAAWEALSKISLFALLSFFMIIAIGQMSTKPISVSPFLAVLLAVLSVSSLVPLRRAVRIEAGIKREIDAHNDVLSMLYKEKMLAKIKSLK